MRRAAIRCFADSYSNDATVLPKVIEVVQQHGRTANWRLLMVGRSPPQTEATLRWTDQW